MSTITATNFRVSRIIPHTSNFSVPMRGFITLADGTKQRFGGGVIKYLHGPMHGREDAIAERRPPYDRMCVCPGRPLAYIAEEDPQAALVSTYITGRYVLCRGTVRGEDYDWTATYRWQHPPGTRRVRDRYDRTRVWWEHKPKP